MGHHPVVTLWQDLASMAAKPCLDVELRPRGRRSDLEAGAKPGAGPIIPTSHGAFQRYGGTPSSLPQARWMVYFKENPI